MKRILITDDSMISRRKLKGMLKKFDAEIIEAVNGIKALELIQSQSFDLILLDLLMPELDCIGVLDALIEKGNKTPVIVVSADIQESTRTICIEKGAFAFINKPQQIDTLLSTVNKALALPGG
jgi:CheY-like chemotaxis protein